MSAYKIIDHEYDVLVVGAGGLGCPVIDYLSRAGVGNIGVVDHDKVNISNIHRQSLYNLRDIGKFKVSVLEASISLNPSDCIWSTIPSAYSFTIWSLALSIIPAKIALLMLLSLLLLFYILNRLWS